MLPFDVQARPGQEELRRNAEYFSHNLVDELVVGLTRIGGLHIVPRTLATRSSGRRESITRIARRVHADQVISGVVKATGERLAIAVTLFDAAEKAGRWTRRYQGAVEDLFKLRDQIVRDVAAEFRIEPAHDAETRIAVKARRGAQSPRVSSVPEGPVLLEQAV